MFDKELFYRICNASCSFDELELFVTDIDKKEFDLDQPFGKYYDVTKIIFAIEKYQSKEIVAKFLAYWMNAYNWIIMGGFKTDYKHARISLKQILIWEIADWIDSLSFFDDDDDWYNLEDYKTTFRVLDSVLKDIDKCEAIFAYNGFNSPDADVLIFNQKEKYFIKVCVDLGFNCKNVDIEKVGFTKLEKQTEQLLDLGYQELKYGFSDDED